MFALSLIVFLWVTVALIPDPEKQWRSNWLRLSLAPDFVIGGKNDPYLRRWWIVPRNKWFNVYVHQILRDDDDRALHDHPWDNCSVILRGRYCEVVNGPGIPWLKLPPLMRFERNAGSIVTRKAEQPHRLELINGEPCWTLFISGPRRREWGFHTADGWVHWKDFTDPNDRGMVRPNAPR